jgi:DNA-binding response OmpR family regulator
MNIIIADDDANLLGMVSDHLRSTGHTAVCVGDGNELFEKLKNFSADLVILDINMPGLDGLAAFEKLRNSEEHKKTPAIIWSGVKIPEGENIALKDQKVRFIKKPFSMVQLNALIKEITGPAILHDYDSYFQ